MGHQVSSRLSDTNTMLQEKNWHRLLNRIEATGADDTWHIEKFDPDAQEVFRLAAIERVRKCRVQFSTEDNWVYQWDGEKINTGRPKTESGVGTTSGLIHPSNVLHDLAHWSVCTSAKRLAMPDFGLGRASESSEGPPRGLRKVADQQEEERASLLGILMELEMGMPAGDTLTLHHWILERYEGRESWVGLNKTLNWLVGHGLISERGKVRWRQVSRGSADIQ